MFLRGISLRAISVSPSPAASMSAGVIESTLVCSPSKTSSKSMLLPSKLSPSRSYMSWSILMSSGGPPGCLEIRMSPAGVSMPDPSWLDGESMFPLYTDSSSRSVDSPAVSSVVASVEFPASAESSHSDRIPPTPSSVSEPCRMFFATLHASQL